MRGSEAGPGVTAPGTGGLDPRALGGGQRAARQRRREELGWVLLRRPCLRCPSACGVPGRGG